VRGSTLFEFALAWPLLMLLVLGSVQVTLWGTEIHNAQAAALAGASLGSASGGSAEAAAEVTVTALRPGLFGARVEPWCPGSGGASPAPVWVCAQDQVGEVQVRVEGQVPSLLPVLPGLRGLPIRADAAIQKERFRP
jgi:hypothetical protein